MNCEGHRVYSETTRRVWIPKRLYRKRDQLGGAGVMAATAALLVVVIPQHG